MRRTQDGRRTCGTRLMRPLRYRSGVVDLSTRGWKPRTCYGHIKPYGLQYHYYVKAGLLLRERIDYDDGAIVEMVIWRIPERFDRRATASSIRCSMAVQVSAWLATTTSAGRETTAISWVLRWPNAFSGVEQLMVDFWSDVRTLRGGK